MELSKMKDEKKLDLCRWYFRAGFLCLPFLWFVNTIWFFKEAFTVQTFDEQKEIKKYVILSGIGAIIWTILIITWVTVFQTHRAIWGELGDDLTFMIPTGTA